jgi:hypothetical protein
MLNFSIKAFTLSQRQRLPPSHTQHMLYQLAVPEAAATRCTLAWRCSTAKAAGRLEPQLATHALEQQRWLLRYCNLEQRESIYAAAPKHHRTYSCWTATIHAFCPHYAAANIRNMMYCSLGAVAVSSAASSLLQTCPICPPSATVLAHHLLLLLPPALPSACLQVA